MENEKEINIIIDHAVNGDREALEKIVLEVKDFVFNLSLRMLGTIADAEDASQEILIKIITNLSMFKMNSKFETWVYRIATNYLIDYKKSMFAQYPLDFDYYANDLKFQSDQGTADTFNENERIKLSEELKLSCTNVMLQCLTPLNRCVFIMGTMFNLNSQWSSEILGLTPQSYRQRLSRSRKSMQEFLLKNCEHAGGACRCNRRVEYAVQNSRLNPENLEYSKLKVLDKPILKEHKAMMEKLEDQADVFKNLTLYNLEIDGKAFLNELLSSKDVEKILNFSQEEIHGKH